MDRGLRTVKTGLPINLQQSREDRTKVSDETFSRVSSRLADVYKEMRDLSAYGEFGVRVKIENGRIIKFDVITEKSEK